MFRLWVSDLDSPSYFVASAAVVLGFFKQKGIDVELVHNTQKGPDLMREGSIEFVAGSAYVAHSAFPACKGLKILCALSQYAYWFMAVRADLNVRKGDLTSSARASSIGGTSRPSAFAGPRLMTNSNFVGCSTGRRDRC